ncbi:hypothetical protein BDB00DRAFT_12840 [Zychaea mexicana]|uniref:uncharacterized protein n=1 Tax=Zychaea mexicana TaxID=64656 RepID=UPI0022FE4BAA|nr:uncharacterized protein BDB00DRAFT_12840 [Zychaea mexicana]KAI9499696.1 hypothetical protein BDB00DRAFT_12840 [Zychaea mexicana]
MSNHSNTDNVVDTIATAQPQQQQHTLESHKKHTTAHSPQLVFKQDSKAPSSNEQIQECQPVVEQQYNKEDDDEERTSTTTTSTSVGATAVVEQKPRRVTHVRQLFVGNLPFRVRWQDLKDLFRKAGNVQRADVALSFDNRSKGHGTVLFATVQDAQRAIGNVYSSV